MALRHFLTLSLIATLVGMCVGASYAQTPYNEAGYRWQYYFGAANNHLDNFNAKAQADSAAAANAAPGGSTYVPGSGNSVLSHSHLPIPKHPILPSVRIDDNEKVIYCMPGTTLSLAGDEIKGFDYEMCELNVDRRRASVDSVCNVTQKYLLYWTATDLGDHTLRIVFVAPGASRFVISRTVVVKVVGKCPMALAQLPDAVIDADATTPITHVELSDFKPARAEVVVDDYGFPIPEDKSNLVIPVSHMPEGDYAVSMMIYDAQNERFVTMPKTIRVVHSGDLGAR